MRLALIICVTFFLTAIIPIASAEPAGRPLLDLADPAVVQHIAPSSAQVTFAADHGIRATIAPGAENYPGIALKPSGGKPWDLSAFGDVRATVVNTGKGSLSIALRVDNEGRWQDSPSNTESISLKPGESGQVQVIFGYS